MTIFEIAPEPDVGDLYVETGGIDHAGNDIKIPVVREEPLTVFLNGQEIVTLMTVGDHHKNLAVGYLLNQHMLDPGNPIVAVDHDEDLKTIVVRTRDKTDFEEKMRRKTQTSGCAQGTIYGDLMEALDEVVLDQALEVKTSWLYSLQKQINTRPSLYLKAGAIHGCVLCEEDRPLIYVEDVGRHNAVDKIAGYMFLNNIGPGGKMFYTTGRLTSEMVIKTAKMGISVLLSRSGFTAFGVDLARQVGMTLIGRMRGERFMVLSGTRRVVFDDARKEVKTT